MILILAILSGIAIPNMRSSMKREQLAAISLDIVSWLERVRNRAVKNMETCEISITGNDDSYTSLEITSSSPGCNDIKRFNISEQDYAPTDIKLALSDRSESEFSFSPRGSLNRSKEMELTMKGSPTTRCIKLVAPVGLVRSGIKREDTCSYEKEMRY